MMSEAVHTGTQTVTLKGKNNAKAIKRYELIRNFNTKDITELSSDDIHIDAERFQELIELSTRLINTHPAIPDLAKNQKGAAQLSIEKSSKLIVDIRKITKY